MSHRDDAFAEWMEGCPDEYREATAEKFDGSLCAALAGLADSRQALGVALSAYP